VLLAETVSLDRLSHSMVEYVTCRVEYPENYRSAMSRDCVTK
jgi:hypothetical protein